MFPTRRLAQAGFFRRSADEFGRLSKIGKLYVVILAAQLICRSLEHRSPPHPD